jgi:hypothetical protein
VVIQEVQQGKLKRYPCLILSNLQVIKINTWFWGAWYQIILPGECTLTSFYLPLCRRMQLVNKPGGHEIKRSMVITWAGTIPFRIGIRRAAWLWKRERSLVPSFEDHWFS